MSVLTVMHTAVWSRACVLFFALVVARLPDYDTSREATSIIAAGRSHADAAVEWCLGHLATWDGVHFAHIAEFGYVHEHERAFFPLYPFAISALSRILGSFCLGCLSPRSLVLISGVILSNVSFVIAAVLLFLLTKELFHNNDLAIRTVALFCISPASVFMSALYSESLFAVLCFAGLLSLARKHHWVATLFFALATAARSNGTLCCGFLAFEAASRFLPLDRWLLMLPGRPHGDWRRLQWWLSGISEIALLSLRCLFVVAPFAAVQLRGAALFCSIEHPPGTDMSWCLSRPLPNFYGFVQQHYWNQGAFRYWTLKQLPNWILASPSLAIAFSALFAFVFNARHRSKETTKLAFFDAGCLPFVVHMAALAAFAVVCMHVQVATRMLASSCPAFYWWPATMLQRGCRSGWLCIGFFMLYAALGILLFVNFFPWT